MYMYINGLFPLYPPFSLPSLSLSCICEFMLIYCTSTIKYSVYTNKEVYIHVHCTGLMDSFLSILPSPYSLSLSLSLSCICEFMLIYLKIKRQ